jgi:hypothetical protein
MRLDLEERVARLESLCGLDQRPAAETGAEADGYYTTCFVLRDESRIRLEDMWFARVEAGEPQRDAYSGTPELNREALAACRERQQNTEAEVTRLQAELAEATAILADNNESCLTREDVAKGLAYCVRQILERWQGASDEADRLRRELAEERKRPSWRRRGDCWALAARLERERDALRGRVALAERVVAAAAEHWDMCATGDTGLCCALEAYEATSSASPEQQK